MRNTGDLTWWLPKGDYVVDVHRDGSLVRSVPLHVTGPGVRCTLP